MATGLKFYIETYGCQMNVADSEVVAAIMQTTDAELTDNLEDQEAVDWQITLSNGFTIKWVGR